MLKIGDAVITPSRQAKNLGATMDPSLSTIDHVNNIVKSAMFGIRKNQPDTTIPHARVYCQVGTCIRHVKIGFL